MQLIFTASRAGMGSLVLPPESSMALSMLYRPAFISRYEIIPSTTFLWPDVHLSVLKVNKNVRA
jgi:hypothetical protein